jgi:hypothetical protein
MLRVYTVLDLELSHAALVLSLLLLLLQLANGEWKLLQGLGKGAELEAKCDYRVEECLTMARVLQAMNTGKWVLQALAKYLLR